MNTSDSVTLFYYTLVVSHVLKSTSPARANPIAADSVTFKTPNKRSVEGL